MNKNKKILLGAGVGAFIFAFIAMFMGFANGLSIKVTYEGVSVSEEVGKLFDFMFKEGPDNQGALVFGFVCLLLALIAIASFVILNATNKASKGLNTAIIVGTMIALFASFIIMICLRPIVGLPAEETLEGFRVQYKLGAGTICWSIFSLIGMLGMVGALTQNKKAFGVAKSC